MTLAAPFVSRIMEIEKDWIDYNGHLNMAYYNVIFDRGSDEAAEVMGLGPAYARERRLTTYTAEVHVCYVRELHLGDKVTVTFQLIDHDEKRLHAYQEIRHADGWLAAFTLSVSHHGDAALRLEVRTAWRRRFEESPRTTASAAGTVDVAPFLLSESVAVSVALPEDPTLRRLHVLLVDTRTEAVVGRGVLDIAG